MTYITAATNWIDFSWVSRFVNKLVANTQHRAQVNQTIKELSQLSNRELHDIGISRSDIRAVAEGTW